MCGCKPFLIEVRQARVSLSSLVLNLSIASGGDCGGGRTFQRFSDLFWALGGVGARPGEVWQAVGSSHEAVQQCCPFSSMPYDLLFVIELPYPPTDVGASQPRTATVSCS